MVLKSGMVKQGGRRQHIGLFPLHLLPFPDYNVAGSMVGNSNDATVYKKRIPINNPWNPSVSICRIYIVTLNSSTSFRAFEILFFKMACLDSS